MSYIALRQLIQNSAEEQKFLNDMVKSFQHGLWFGVSNMIISKKFEGLASKVINEKTEEL